MSINNNDDYLTPLVIRSAMEHTYIRIVKLLNKKKHIGNLVLWPDEVLGDYFLRVEMAKKQGLDLKVNTKTHNAWYLIQGAKNVVWSDQMNKNYKRNR